LQDNSFLIDLFCFILQRSHIFIALYLTIYLFILFLNLTFEFIQLKFIFIIVVFEATLNFHF